MRQFIFVASFIALLLPYGIYYAGVVQGVWPDAPHVVLAVSGSPTASAWVGGLIPVISLAFAWIVARALTNRFIPERD